MQLCGLFIEVEKEKFYQWLKDFFPVLIKQLQANEQEVVIMKISVRAITVQM